MIEWMVTDNKTMTDMSNTQLIKYHSHPLPLFTLSYKNTASTIFKSCYHPAENAYNKLNAYLNNNRPPRGQNIYIDSYHDILQEFNLIISTIYHNNVLSADILTRSYGWVNGYAYNPFHIWNNDNAMIANIKNTKTILSRMWKDAYYGSSQELRCYGLNTEALDEISNIILESQNNHNKDDVIRLLNDNKERYVALQLIHVLIRDGLPAPSFGNVNRDLAIKHLEIVDALVTKDIINILYNNNDDNSVSVSKSITWTDSAIAPMRSSSSNHTHFQSRANIDMYHRNARDEKARILDELKGPNVLNNDSEPFLGDEWDDMPLSKLRNIIIIKDSANKGTAFYVRTLYQYWRNAVKNGAPFVNPYNRRQFTDNDKENIMIAMEQLYPTIKKPKQGEGRSDIKMEISFFDNNRDKFYITFKYILKMPNRLNLLLDLIKIRKTSMVNVKESSNLIQSLTAQQQEELNQCRAKKYEQKSARVRGYLNSSGMKSTLTESNYETNYFNDKITNIDAERLNTIGSLNEPSKLKKTSKHCYSNGKGFLAY